MAERRSPGDRPAAPARIARPLGHPVLRRCQPWRAELSEWFAGGAPAALGLAILLVYVGFDAGAFFAETVALLTVVLGLALVVWVALAPRPFVGSSPAFALVAAALSLLAAWSLISIAWSHAPVRAIVEYDRVVLYLLAFVLFGAAGRSTGALRWIVRGIAFAAFFISICGLITRLMPDAWHVAPSVADDRLSFPLTYWNALGLLAGIGVVACSALTCDHREAPAGRVLAAAALPVLGVTMLLTFSRGSAAATVVGLLAMVLVARPRALLGGALAAAPTVALALHAAYGADLLASEHPSSVAATAQGHQVAVVVGVCVVVAAALRAALLTVDARLLRGRRATGWPQRPRIWLSAALVACAAGGFVLGAPNTIADQYEGFVRGAPVNSADLRERLTRPGDNGRLDLWDVALDDFRTSPLRGSGAGTYALAWDQRGSGGHNENAHSLYAETLGELGIVGLLLVLASVLLVLGGFLARAHADADRGVAGALFGCGLAWALSAGVDWMWEMPAVTLGMFAAGGLALAGARSTDEPRGARLRWPARLLLAAVVVTVVLLPARIYQSAAPLRASVQAFHRGDCASAAKRASRSAAVLGVRPEPHVLLGYCDLRRGEPARAERELAQAVRRDPGNWEYRYGLALARAAAGRDPRPTARSARRLRPREKLSRDLVALFESGGPAQWKGRALESPLPTE